jgi:hypothetical protein
MSRRQSKHGSNSVRVFDLEACQRRMSVGYIALCMTLAARVQQGRTLLLQAGLFTVLTTVSN